MHILGKRWNIKQSCIVFITTSCMLESLSSNSFSNIHFVHLVFKVDLSRICFLCKTDLSAQQSGNEDVRCLRAVCPKWMWAFIPWPPGARWPKPIWGHPRCHVSLISQVGSRIPHLTGLPWLVGNPGIHKMQNLDANFGKGKMWNHKIRQDFFYLDSILVYECNLWMVYICHSVVSSVSGQMGEPQPARETTLMPPSVPGILMHVVRELLKNSCQASLELATWVTASVWCVGELCRSH